MDSSRNLPAVYVVILSWNGREFLPACLDSVRLQTYRNRTVVVVDNGSTDGSQAFVQQQYPEVILIENGCNLGFSEGNNVGLRFALEAEADYVVLLNQDTEVETKWLEELVKLAEGDRWIGGVASHMRLYTHKTLVNSTGIVMNCAGQAWDRGFGRVDGTGHRWAKEVLGVTGGAMFLRAQVLHQVGLLDPAYFAYYEDLDLSVRIWEAGYRLVYGPGAVLYHKFSGGSVGDESPQKRILIQSNRWRFLLKHFPSGQLLWRHGPVLLLREVRTLGRLLRQRNFFELRLRLRAYWRVVVGTPRILGYRWSSNRRVGETPHWWRLVIPGYKEPEIFFPRQDFRFAEAETEAATDRLLMGVSDAVLGEGWDPLTQSGSPDGRGEINPAFRWFGRSATCFLRVPHPGMYILQMHISQPFAALGPPRLEVFCNGKAVGNVLVETYQGEWWTVQFQLRLDKTAATVRLVVDRPILREHSGAYADLGLRVNEISLLPPGSAFLRASIWTREGVSEEAWKSAPEAQ